jgi:hypothetical protein
VWVASGNTGSMPPLRESTYKIEGQSQEINYVPVLHYENKAWNARMRDTFGATQTLDDCKKVLAERAAQPKTGRFKDLKITEHVCYEVKKSGGQRKIVIGPG